MDVPVSISFAVENYRTDYNLAARQTIHDYARPQPQDVPILDVLDWTDAPAVLDVGCGNGKWLTQAKLRSGGPIIGLDLSAGMLTAVARRDTGTSLIQADAADLPIADGSFDRVLAMWMLYHVADRDRAVGELRRVLRPGGQALVVTNGSTHLSELVCLVDSAASDVLGRPVKGCVPASEFTLDEAAPMLAHHFSRVTCRVFHRFLDVPDPAIVVAYVESVRSRLGYGLADRWDDFARALQLRCQLEVDDHGGVRITTLTGAFMCE